MRRFVDGAPVPRITQGCIHTEYVDNFISLSRSQHAAERAATEVAAALSDAGLPLHPVEISQGGDTLGWHFDEWRPAAGAAPRTAWRLIAGIREILRRGRAKVTGNVVDVRHEIGGRSINYRIEFDSTTVPFLMPELTNFSCPISLE